MMSPNLTQRNNYSIMMKTWIQFQLILILVQYNSKELCIGIISAYIKQEMTEQMQLVKCVYIITNLWLWVIFLEILQPMVSLVWLQLQEMNHSFRIFSTKVNLSNHSSVLTLNIQKMSISNLVSTLDGSIILKLKVVKMVYSGTQTLVLMLGLY